LEWRICDRPVWRRKEQEYGYRRRCRNPKSASKGVVQDFVADYDHVVVDECHHPSAFTFESVLRRIKAKYVLGLTATPTRKDGHHPIIYMQCGPIRFFLSAWKAARFSPFKRKVIPRFTNFVWNNSDSGSTIHEIYAALVADAPRNDMIVE